MCNNFESTRNTCLQIRGDHIRYDHIKCPLAHLVGSTMLTLSFFVKFSLCFITWIIFLHDLTDADGNQDEKG